MIDSDKLPFSPHDLLPVENPTTDTTEYEADYFYKNVVQHLVEDMVRMQMTGIPISLKKVGELEDTVISVLQKVHDKLRQNDLMLQFLKETSTGIKKLKIAQLESKKKEPEEFLKPFDPKNKVHRTYVVNFYLKDRPDLQMEEWSLKDLKKLNQVHASAFIQNLIDKKSITEPCFQWMQNQIDLAMEQLAKDKCEAYNKNRIDSKIQSLDNNDIITLFNPGSDVQKRNLMKFLGIESENTTKAGNEQFNRAELERIQKLVNFILEEKENKLNE